MGRGFDSLYPRWSPRISIPLANPVIRLKRSTRSGSKPFIPHKRRTALDAELAVCMRECQLDIPCLLHLTRMIEPVLQKFLTEQVNPHPSVVEQASDSQSWLRQVLKNKLREQADLPSVLEGHDFLFGSAIRGTHTAPFDDVDLMLVLDGSALICIENGQQIGSAYGIQTGTNVLLQPQYLDANGHVSSQKVVSRIRNALDETYSRSDVRKDAGQAINVWLDSYGFGIDVVPAIKVTTQACGDHYYIPQGTGSDMWMSTNPHADLSAYEQGDLLANRLLRPTARLMRKWNELSNGERLSGFHVDALTLRALSGRQIQTLQEGVAACLGSFGDLLTSACPQLSGIGPHIDQKLTGENRAASIRAVANAYSAVQTAQNAGVFGTRTQIHAAWNRVFGDNLPSI